MIESLEKLSETKVKLSVPLIASFITKRHCQGVQRVRSSSKQLYQETLCRTITWLIPQTVSLQ